MGQLENLIKKHLRTLSEGEMPQENYMFFGNIEQMKRQCELLMQEDKDQIDGILKQHDWAQDHIAEAKSLLDQVFDFLMNQTKGDDQENNVKADISQFSMNEDMDDDDNEVTPSDYDSLKKINNRVNREEVIQWFNDSDIDYYNMTDIEMYLIYLKKHMNNDDLLNEEYQIDESKNCPTDPAKWSASKSAAKAKFDVYPSAYANGWAAKNYKSKGGKWKKCKK